jgi:protein CpxP
MQAMFTPAGGFFMRPWLKRTLIGVFGASALFGGFAAWSQHPHGFGRWESMSEADVARFKSRAIDHATRSLALDAVQQARLGVLIDTLQQQRQALRGSADPRAQFQALMGDGTFDRWHAQDLINSKLASVRDGSPKLVAAAGDFYDSLRPEQQRQVRDFLQRRHGPWS